MAEKPNSVKSRSAAADQFIMAAKAAQNAPPAAAPTAPEDGGSSTGGVPPDTGLSGDGREPAGVGPSADAPPQVPASKFQAPEPAPAGDGSQDDPEPPASGDPGDNFEHRFKVLQGKYKAETSRNREEINNLTAQLNDMRNLLAMMSEHKDKKPAAPAAATAAPELATAAPEPPRELVSKRELEAFDTDLLDVAKRFVMQDVLPELAKLRKQITDLSTKVGEANATASTVKNTVAKSARQQMYAHLNEQVRGWEKINDEQEFKAWLAERDPFSGEQRNTLLLRAYERNDGPTVANFFKTFKAEHASTTGDEPAGSVPADDGNPAPAAADTRPKVDPSALVAPGRGRNAPHNGAQQKILWTPQDIARFYADVKHGVYKSKPDEHARLEADIFAAQKEGRVAV